MTCSDSISPVLPDSVYSDRDVGTVALIQQQSEDLASLVGAAVNNNDGSNDTESSLA